MKKQDPEDPMTSSSGLRVALRLLIPLYKVAEEIRNILISFHSLFSKTGKSPLNPLGLFCT